MIVSMMTAGLGCAGAGLPVTSALVGHSAIYSTPVLWQAIPGAFLMRNLV